MSLSLPILRQQCADRLLAFYRSAHAGHIDSL